MATNILMPALSPTMTEGTLARWLKKEGDTIKAGDVIAEIETDKATMEVEAVDEGVLGKILIADGTAGVAVNAPIAILVGDGEAVPSGAPAASAPAPNAAAPEPVPAAGPTLPAPVASAAAEPKPAASVPAAALAANGRVFASPLAKRLAAAAGISLTAIKGTGPNGRIVRADVERAQAAPKPAAAAPAPAPAAAAPAPAPAAPAGAVPVYRPAATPITAPHSSVPNSTMRKTIARRLSESKTFVPHFYLTVDVELDALLKLRADLNAKSTKDGPGAFKLSVNDLLIKACAIALHRMPKVNASYTEEAAIYYDDVDISVAVSVPDGLITPIVRKADLKGLATISNEMKDLAARARSNKLKLDEFQGGGFSLSNLGMFGIKEFAAIINPPQGAILAVGAGEKRAVVKNDQLAIATVMSTTLAIDHRVIDGALGAEWLALFKSLVEDPLSLML